MILLLPLALLLFGFIVNASALDPVHIYQKVGPSVARVVDKAGGVGSGFVVSTPTKRMLITNAHVCGTDSTLKVQFQLRRIEYIAKVLHIYIREDLCLLSLNDSTIPALSLADTVSPWEWVAVVGHPGGRALNVAPGRAIQIIRVEMVFNPPCIKGDAVATDTNGYKSCTRLMDGLTSSAIAVGGNSGGPLVNSKGEVVGVVFAQVNSPVLRPERSTSVILSVLKAILAKH